jgi:hypothetical protein
LTCKPPIFTPQVAVIAAMSCCDAQHNYRGTSWWLLHFGNSYEATMHTCMQVVYLYFSFSFVYIVFKWFE